MYSPHLTELASQHAAEMRAEGLRRQALRRQALRRQAGAGRGGQPGAPSPSLAHPWAGFRHWVGWTLVELGLRLAR
jgi:hypothetical protein